METKRGVKAGTKRGSYASKYTTEEERKTAKKAMQKQYYLKRKAENATKTESPLEQELNQIIVEKEEEIDSLGKKIKILEKKNKLLQKQISDQEKRIKMLESRKFMSQVEEIDKSAESSTDKNGSEKYTEEIIQTYIKRKPHFKNSWEYDIHIEEIIAERNRKT